VLVFPDYAPVLKEIDRLLPPGLGEQLLEAAAGFIEHIQQMTGRYGRDDGYLLAAGAMYSAAASLIKALSRDEADKILLAIDILRAGIHHLDHRLSDYLETERPPKVFTRVVEELERRLSSPGAAKDFWRFWLILALKKSGRPDLVISLCEREFDAAQGYQPLAGLLIEEGLFT
jgi:hypothetical protein